MADQFCPHCGTEVDADARFCPTCGRTLLNEPEEPIEAGEAAAATPESGAHEASPIPPAPAWPPPEPTEAVPPLSEPGGDQEQDEAADEEPEPPAPAAASPPPVAPPPPTPPPAQSAPQERGGRQEMPFTVPVMLSGWLIGAGSGFGALALLPRLASPLNALLFLALLWVTATVFLADRMPDFPHQRLAILVVVMVGTGAALDRAGFRVNVSSIFLIAMLVAAAGVLLVELGRDRPVQNGGS